MKSCQGTLNTIYSILGAENRSFKLFQEVMILIMTNHCQAFAKPPETALKTA
jgi:hypothetical protein